MSVAAHIFAGLITIPCLLFIMRMVRRNQLRAKYAVLWAPIGSAMVLLSVWPGLLNHVSAIVGISYPPATLFLVAIVLLLLITVHFSWELSRLEERTRVLAEELALLLAQLPSRTGESVADAPAGATDVESLSSRLR